MKIPVKLSLNDIYDNRYILKQITAELYRAHDPRNLDKSADILNIESITHRLTEKALNHAARPRNYQVKIWLTLPELATLSRAVTLYYFKLDPLYQVVIREGLFNPALMAYHNIYTTNKKH